MVGMKGLDTHRSLNVKEHTHKKTRQTLYACQVVLKRLNTERCWELKAP